MAHGINHAKKIVIDQAEDLATKLENGEAACAKTQGQATALLLKMLTPIYEMDLVSEQDCEKRHARSRSDNQVTKLKVGPIAFEGTVTPAILMTLPSLVCTITTLFIIGKWQGWW